MTTAAIARIDPYKRNMLIGGGVVLLIVIAALIVRARARRDTTPSGGPALAGSLEQRGTALAAQTITIGDQCAIAWTSPTAITTLADHAEDFFRPAVAAAKEAGQTSIDGQTAWVCRLLAPQCVWPPTELGGIDLDKAATGELEGVADNAKWAFVSKAPRVQLYVAVRQIVRALNR